MGGCHSLRNKKSGKEISHDMVTWKAEGRVADVVSFSKSIVNTIKPGVLKVSVDRVRGNRC